MFSIREIFAVLVRLKENPQKYQTCGKQTSMSHKSLTWSQMRNAANQMILPHITTLKVMPKLWLKKSVQNQNEYYLHRTPDRSVSELTPTARQRTKRVFSCEKTTLKVLLPETQRKSLQQALAHVPTHLLSSRSHSPRCYPSRHLCCRIKFIELHWFSRSWRSDMNF